MSKPGFFLSALNPAPLLRRMPSSHTLTAKSGGWNRSNAGAADRFSDSAQQPREAGEAGEAGAAAACEKSTTRGILRTTDSNKSRGKSISFRRRQQCESAEEPHPKTAANLGGGLAEPSVDSTLRTTGFSSISGELSRDLPGRSTEHIQETSCVSC